MDSLHGTSDLGLRVHGYSFNVLVGAHFGFHGWTLYVLARSFALLLVEARGYPFLGLGGGRYSLWLVEKFLVICIYC